jgi:hypothetical protein
MKNTENGTLCAVACPDQKIGKMRRIINEVGWPALTTNSAKRIGELKY